MTEVRIKLHIKANNEAEVKNLWMCLNYDNKPSISHVIDHVKNNLCTQKNGQEIVECKLYLDNYWLPPYENSRLLRENDCVKVEVSYKEIKSKSETNVTSEKYATLNQNVLDHLKQTEKRISEIQSDKLSYNYGSKALSAEEIATVEAATRAATNMNYYNHYYDNNDYQSTYQQNAKTYNSNNIDYYNYWANNDLYNNQMVQQNYQEEANKSKSKISNKQKNESSKNLSTNLSPSKKVPATVSKPSKEITKCNKKFAIGGFVHCLNEVVEPPVVTKSNKKVKEKKISK